MAAATPPYSPEASFSRDLPFDSSTRFDLPFGPRDRELESWLGDRIGEEVSLSLEVHRSALGRLEALILSKFFLLNMPSLNTNYFHFCSTKLFLHMIDFEEGY